MSDGWIKLHRQIIETEDWLHEPFTRGQAWVDMLLLANHTNGSFRVRGIVVNLIRGQLGWSEDSLAKRWKWSRGKVRRFFSELESETVHRIVQQKNNVSSIITILNYDKYQSNDTADSTANGTTNGQQTDSKRYTNKNDKNGNNGKNDKKNTIDIPSELLSIDGFEESWNEWLEHLKEKKKRPTSLAMKRQLEKLATVSDPVSVICRCIEKNWQGIYLNESDCKQEGKAIIDPYQEFADNIAANDPLVFTPEQLKEYENEIKRQRGLL